MVQPPTNDGKKDPSVWFYCKMCRQVFSQKFQLLRHKRRQHPPQSSSHHLAASKQQEVDHQEDEEDEEVVCASIKIISREQNHQPIMEETKDGGHVTHLSINEQIDVAAVPMMIQPVIQSSVSMVPEEEDDEVQIISPLCSHPFQQQSSRGQKGAIFETIKCENSERPIAAIGPRLINYSLVTSPPATSQQSCWPILAKNFCTAPSSSSSSSRKQQEEGSFYQRKKVGGEIKKNEHKVTSILERLLRSRSSTKEKGEGNWEPKFGCSFCGRLFTYPGSCKVHERIHTVGEERNFQCRFCAKNFTRSNIRNRHMASVHNMAGEISHYSSLAQKNEQEIGAHEQQEEEDAGRWKIRKFVASGSSTTFTNGEDERGGGGGGGFETENFTQIQIHRQQQQNISRQPSSSFDHSQLIVTCWPTVLNDNDGSANKI